MRFLPGSLLTVVAVLLTCAATAQAQQRYAAPAPVGNGSSCTKVAPCTLATAIENAKDNDEVIVGTGTYTLTEGLSPIDYEVENLFVHGDFEAPMPVITNSANGTSTLWIGGFGGGVLSWVDVRASGLESSAILCSNTTVERVRASSSGAEGPAMVGALCNIRDSLAVASGQNSTAIAQYAFEDGFTGSVVNSTALATGPSSNALTVSFPSAFLNGTYTVEVTNTIAQGTNADLHAIGSGGEVGKFVISHSNFDNATKQGTGIVTDGGGNQSAAPLFVNAAAGDYAEAAGSPTIDAGIATPAAGALDLAASARTQGGAIDIGAFEFPAPAPPPIQTPAAGRIQSIAITPPKFVAANLGGAVISKKGKKAPVGATVFFAVNAPATVTFKAERRTTGRKVGKKCVKQTKANRGKAKCALLKPVKGSFTVAGVAGPNTFKFSGRIGNRTLGPGKYMLSGSSGGATKRVAFRIVK
jgi:hypothetical protein